ncbi:aldo-keto reductase family 1 member A1-A-like isoform X2 [Rhinatrema bivittatum]|nr:aldo-keto reductase family 1 member A1-A-like isoform X2 [Rhinatrema bivittatum]
MHWPMAFQRGNEVMPRNRDGSMRHDPTHFIDTWKAMEQLVEKGLVKAIGLSNFNARQVDEVLAVATHKPAVNQVECHPYLMQEELLQHCQRRGIALTAYSPLGSADRPWAKAREPKLLEDPGILALAQRCGKTPAQVILRWQLQRGVTCIPKSSTPSRIKENLEVFDFSLSEDDMKTIASFNRGERLIIPLMEKDGKQVWRDAGHPHFPFHDPY